MKKIHLLIIAILLFSLSGCHFFESKDEVITSLEKIKHKDFYTSGGFQDFTDYAKYSFHNPQLEGNDYLHPMTAQDISILYSYLANFESWIDMASEDSELAANYDFDSSVVDREDWFYLYENPNYPFVNGICGSYSIYFFDTQSGILYFFHSNI